MIRTELANMLFKKVQKVLLKFGTEDNMQRLLPFLLKAKLETVKYIIQTSESSPFVDVVHQFINDVANGESWVSITNSLDMIKERSIAYKVTKFLSFKHNCYIFHL